MTNNLKLNEIDQQLLDLALQEDLKKTFCDITTQTLFSDKTRKHSVEIVSKSKENIVICGLCVIPELIKKVTDQFQIETTYKDGNILAPEKRLLTINSDAITLLMLERTILNILRHLSAIATLTKRFVDKVADTSLKILDTRKTTPGMRHLEKFAVTCGGGANHRMGLYDAIMIKDTHIDLIGGLKLALEKLPKLKYDSLPVIVETRNLDEINKIIEYGKDKISRVLLDNMSLKTMYDAVQLCNTYFEIEASGNINLENILDIANTGVNYASIGMLTYAAGQIDLSMRALTH